MLTMSCLLLQINTRSHCIHSRKLSCKEITPKCYVETIKIYVIIRCRKMTVQTNKGSVPMADFNCYEFVMFTRSPSNLSKGLVSNEVLLHAFHKGSVILLSAFLTFPHPKTWLYTALLGRGGMMGGMGTLPFPSGPLPGTLSSQGPLPEDGWGVCLQGLLWAWEGSLRLWQGWGRAGFDREGCERG